jgi:hypothetical protein
MSVAQWYEMESFNIQNALTASSGSPQVPQLSPLSTEETTTSGSEAPTVGAVLAGMVRHPVRHLIGRWNWKSTVLSSLLRATIFFFTNLVSGWHAAIGAMLAELAFRSVTSGFYGAITESFSTVRPAWTATVAAMVALPFLAHSLEFLVHWLRGTPKLGLSIATSVVFTALSTAFNLYAMRRGVLVVGEKSKSLRHDLSQIAPLLLSFILAGPHEIARRLRRAFFPQG